VKTHTEIIEEIENELQEEYEALGEVFEMRYVDTQTMKLLNKEAGAKGTGWMRLGFNTCHGNVNMCPVRYLSLDEREYRREGENRVFTEDERKQYLKKCKSPLWKAINS